MKKELGGLLVFTVLVCFLPVINANSLDVFANSSQVNTSQTINIQIRINAIESDVFALQFDVNYNPSILTLNSITEGNFLKSDGASTIFNYTSFGGGLANNIYNARNKTYSDPSPGITGTNGTIAVLSFTAISSGVSSINLSDVTWVNSSITNDSIKEPDFTYEGINILVSSSDNSSDSNLSYCGDSVCNNGETCSSCPSDCGACSSSSSSSSGGSSSGGGGGGGGSSTTKIINNTNNNTNGSNQSGKVSFEIEKPSNNDNNQNQNDSLENQSSSGSSITGGVINNLFGKGSVFRSWVFYFVLGLIGIFATVLYFRRRHKRNFFGVSKY
jgi:hypothetical protein